MDLLVCLAKRNGEVVPKPEIFQEVWPGTFVSDDALTRCIGELRRALHESAQQPGILETVAKRGYRIAAPIRWDDGTSPMALPDPADPTGDAGPAPPRRAALRLGIALAFTLALAGVVFAVWGPRHSRRPGWSAHPVQSIVVLPLDNLTGDSAQEYFADGMTEALTSDLAKLGTLRVISRTSAMTYKASRKSAGAIARELKVDAVVEGSVMRSGRRVRIHAQLIDGATDLHMWAETYERDLEDVLRLQAEVAAAIAGRIDVAMSPADRARLAYQPRINPEAYDLYLKGMFHLNKFTPEGFDQGIAYLQQAVDKNPTDPFPLAALALGYGLVGHDRFPDALIRAKSAARKSLELGGPVAEAYVGLGMAKLYYDWDLAGAGMDLQRAIDLKPNLAEAYRDHSWYLRLLCRPQEGLAEMQRAEELEPLDPLFPADLAWQFYEEGRLDSAMIEAKEATELNPNYSEGLAIQGWVFADWHKLDEALAVHRKAASADADWKWPLGRTYALTGRREDAKKIAAEIEKSPGAMGEWGLAVIYAALDDRDAAFRWVDAAIRSRFSWMPWLFDFSRRRLDLFTPLRKDPRYDAVIRKIGIPDAQHLAACSSGID